MGLSTATSECQSEPCVTGRARSAQQCFGSNFNPEDHDENAMRCALLSLYGGCGCGCGVPQQKLE